MTSSFSGSGGTPPSDGPPVYGSPPPGTGGPSQTGGPPTYGSPPEGGGPGQPWTPGYPGGSQPGGRGTGRRGLLLSIIAVVLVVVVGGGGFAAYNFLGGTGEEPDQALPGNALGYVRIDMNPSATDKLAGVRLLEKFPAFAHATKIHDENLDLRRYIFDKAQANSDACPGVSYDNDIAPWIGDLAGLAVLPPTGGSTEPDAVFAVQVRDQDKAAAAVDKLTACAKDAHSTMSSQGLGSVSSDKPGVAFLGDYMLLAEKPALVERYKRAAQSSPLSDNSQFSSDMSQLGDPGVMSAWLSIRGILDYAREQSPQVDRQLSHLNLQQAHSAAVALRFNASYMELASVSSGAKTPAHEVSNPIVSLPASTVAAMSVSHGREQVGRIWKALAGLVRAEGTRISDLRAQIRSQTGLSMPTDLETVLGDNLLLALDSHGLTPRALQSNAGPSAFNFGAKFTTDVAAFHRVLHRLQSATGQPLPVKTVDTKGAVVLASNGRYAHKLTRNGGLGDVAAFQLAVPDAATADMAFYLSFDAAEPVLDSALESSGAPNSVERNLQPLQAIGISTHHTSDGYSEGTIRVTVQ